MHAYLKELFKAVTDDLTDLDTKYRAMHLMLKIRRDLSK